MRMRKMVGVGCLVGLGSLATLGVRGDLTPTLDAPSPRAVAIIATMTESAAGWSASNNRPDEAHGAHGANGAFQDEYDWLVYHKPSAKNATLLVQLGNRWASVWARKDGDGKWIRISRDMTYADGVHVNRAAKKLYDDLMTKQHQEAIPEEFR